MSESRMRMGGAVCFWRIVRQVLRERLAEELERLGFGKYVPEPRKPSACLKEALAEVFPTPKGQKQVIRPLKNGDGKGFAVVRENPDGEARVGSAWGEVVATALIDEENGTVSLEPYDSEKATQLREAMAEAQRWLTTASVGGMLVNLVDRCDGLCLRDGGGMYWVREDWLETWRNVRAAVESAPVRGEGNNSVYALTVLPDEEMIRAVGDALTAEVDAQIAAIEAEIAEGNLGEAACDARVKRAGALDRKVKRYEAAFDKPLEALHAALKRTSIAALQAACQQGASPMATVDS